MARNQTSQSDTNLGRTESQSAAPPPPPPPNADSAERIGGDTGHDRGDHGGDRVRYEGAGIAAGFIALLVAAALVLIVVGQNVDDVPFEFLWWEADVPLAVLLLATGLLVLFLGEVVGLVWRRRRRNVRSLTEQSRRGR